jgi:dipicolinate synthase subunit A
MKLDELAIYNAVPTAEGVVQILIEKTPVTINGMRCAVTGYGKVGKALASTLKALGADVTVFARKEQDFAVAYTSSIKAEDYSTLKQGLNNYDALINTVPAKIIDKDIMLHLKPDCLLIETASAPFGIDFQAAKELAFEVVKAGSLPGKVAPRSAGEIIGRSIIPIINKGVI